MSARGRSLAIAERCLLVAGVILLVTFLGASLYRSIASRLALREFDKVQAALSPEADERADFSLWADTRIQAYRESLLIRKGAPLAVLRVVRLNIRVPVLEGTDEFALNRGVGWIPGTARPDEAGNIGIAGHRDGFFRSLKDVALGDAIELSTTHGAATYIVNQMEIVTPEEIRVLQPRGVPSLTLVTCYPFYFVGDAPRRFILHAARSDGKAPSGSRTVRFPRTR